MSMIAEHIVYWGLALGNNVAFCSVASIPSFPVVAKELLGVKWEA